MNFELGTQDYKLCVVSHTLHSIDFSITFNIVFQVEQENFYLCVEIRIKMLTMHSSKFMLRNKYFPCNYLRHNK